ncbi:MAG: hypothetical protein KIH63_000510 [Candidatus Saccharibacteria bacterium]|nr:hypothetical protein [Candidatus Saccharibacteria bacterium]
MRQNEPDASDVYMGGEVPHESVGSHMFAPHLTNQLQDPSLSGFVYPLTDSEGNRHLITPDSADGVEHDPETGLNFLHKHGKRIATVGGFVGAAVLLAVGAAHVIDKKRQS